MSRAPRLEDAAIAARLDKIERRMLKLMREVAIHRPSSWLLREIAALQADLEKTKA